MNRPGGAVLLGALALVAAYPAAYLGIKRAQPWCLNSNDGPGSFYCRLFYPARYLDAARPDWYWSCLRQGHWIEAKVISNNLGNGYLTFELPTGRYRAGCGWDLKGAREGEHVALKCSFELRTWDDFADHLVPSVDDVRRTVGETRGPVASRAVPKGDVI